MVGKVVKSVLVCPLFRVYSAGETATICFKFGAVDVAGWDAAGVQVVDVGFSSAKTPLGNTTFASIITPPINAIDFLISLFVISKN